MSGAPRRQPRGGAPRGADSTSMFNIAHARRGAKIIAKFSTLVWILCVICGLRLHIMQITAGFCYEKRLYLYMPN